MQLRFRRRIRMFGFYKCRHDGTVRSAGDMDYRMEMILSEPDEWRTMVYMKLRG